MDFRFRTRKICEGLCFGYAIQIFLRVLWQIEGVVNSEQANHFQGNGTSTQGEKMTIFHAYRKT